MTFSEVYTHITCDFPYYNFKSSELQKKSKIWGHLFQYKNNSPNKDVMAEVSHCLYNNIMSFFFSWEIPSNWSNRSSYMPLFLDWITKRQHVLSSRFQLVCQSVAPPQFTWKQPAVSKNTMKVSLWTEPYQASGIPRPGQNRRRLETDDTLLSLKDAEPHEK